MQLWTAFNSNQLIVSVWQTVESIQLSPTPSWNFEQPFPTPYILYLLIGPHRFLISSVEWKFWVKFKSNASRTLWFIILSLNLSHLVFNQYINFSTSAKCKNYFTIFFYFFFYFNVSTSTNRWMEINLISVLLNALPSFIPRIKSQNFWIKNIKIKKGFSCFVNLFPLGVLFHSLLLNAEFSFQFATIVFNLSSILLHIKRLNPR